MVEQYGPQNFLANLFALFHLDYLTICSESLWLFTHISSVALEQAYVKVTLKGMWWKQ